MKIYTGTGDRGKTALFSGEKVAKNHIRVETYGDVDELNSVIGALITAFSGQHPELIQELHAIQSHLLQIGAWLATTCESPLQSRIQKITEDHWKFLEQAIDRMDQHLPELHEFILPGGHPAAAWAHIARTVCRRAERHVVGLSEHEHADQDDWSFLGVITYLNRLSDYLFMLARYCNQLFEQADGSP
ncbi:ATP/cobalamin adenosyltransferase [Candidatus Vecturithrix granuli]|uniref:Corrinoid adenosyltransferase n=1 Tax=Vecturithrix granuli TaxID=1499967 RepID=A0A081BWM0_VECG1|nr:ATP/cobalamin adenosyltransferase [Candidatus Vecturithrix granuli]